EYFATMFYAEYRDQGRELRYINCGHPAALIVRTDGTVERLEATALPVGVFGSLKCEEKSVALDAGDILLAVSDGVLEAGVDRGEEFGEERLIEGARSEPEVERMLDQILDRVHQFSPDGQGDDVTVVALKGQHTTA